MVLVFDAVDRSFGGDDPGQCALLAFTAFWVALPLAIALRGAATADSVTLWSPSPGVWRRPGRGKRGLQHKGRNQSVRVFVTDRGITAKGRYMGEYNSGPEEAVKGVVEGVKGKAKEVVGASHGPRRYPARGTGPAGQGRFPARGRQEGSGSRRCPRSGQGQRGPREGRAELVVHRRGPVPRTRDWAFAPVRGRTQSAGRGRRGSRAGPGRCGPRCRRRRC